jgi:hypothetical protein
VSLLFRDPLFLPCRLLLFSHHLILLSAVSLPMPDLDVTIDGNQLIIKAERTHFESKESDTVHANERWHGQVQRTLRLPPNCDANKANVTFKHGVLNICLPTKEGTVTKKKLSVSSEEGGVVF